MLLDVIHIFNSLKLRMLELQGSGCNSFQGGLWILALLPTWGTWLFLTVHPRACSLFYLHLAFLDPADLFADNICIAYYNKSEQWPAQSFTKFYQLPVVDASLPKGLKANAVSSDVQPPLALSSPGTGGPYCHVQNKPPILATGNDSESTNQGFGVKQSWAKILVLPLTSPSFDRVI